MQSLNQYRLRIKGKSALSEYRSFVLGGIAYKDLDYLSSDVVRTLKRLTPVFFNLAIASNVSNITFNSLKKAGCLK